MYKKTEINRVITKYFCWLSSRHRELVTTTWMEHGVKAHSHCAR